MSAPQDDIKRGFVHTLVDDVLAALDRVEASNTPLHRREAIRTIFVAIEGVVWVYREHVRSVAKDLTLMTPLLDLALREKTYVVSDRGDLSEQPRFVPLTALIRLTTKLAAKSCPGFEIDFGHVGWSNLKLAIAIRNRLTHPKTEADLTITPDELATAKSGWFWLLALVIQGMEAGNAQIAKFNVEARTLLGRLVRGDEAALAQYRQAQLSDDD